jgi:hypothetical protein
VQYDIAASSVCTVTLHKSPIINTDNGRNGLSSLKASEHHFFTAPSVVGAGAASAASVAVSAAPRSKLPKVSFGGVSPSGPSGLLPTLPCLYLLLSLLSVSTVLDPRPYSLHTR